jgi:zinc protease
MFFDLNRVARGVILMSALSWWGCSSPPPHTGHDGRPTLFPYRESVLKNGLRVITLEDRSCPIVAVQVWYHVGSKDEHPDRQGFAHLFEHMMFRGTDRLGPTDHFDLIRGVGGSTNGFTQFDATTYIETVPSPQIELALWLEAERMSFLTINPEGFETERKVVEEERRMGLNRPYGDLFDKALPAIFREHPYRWSPIGNIAHLRAARVSELREWWRRRYTPNNATLVIAGDVAHERAAALAERYFGWIPAVEAPRAAIAREPDRTEAAAVILKLENAPAPGGALVWRTAGESHPDVLGLDLLATILGGGASSRLYRRLVQKQSLAVYSLAFHYTLEQDGLFAAAAVLSPMGSDLDRALAAVRDEVERLRTEGVTPREMEKARNQKLRELVFKLLAVDDKALALGESAVMGGDPALLDRRLRRLRDLSSSDLHQLARSYLDPKKTIAVQVPGGGFLGALKGITKLFSPERQAEEAAAVAVETDPSPPPPGRPGVVRPADYPRTPPVRDAIVDFTDPIVHRWQLANGLKVLAVKNAEVPVVFAELLLPSGAWCEEKPGAANLALAMLTRGTERFTEEALAEELETLAIQVAGSAGMDASQISASCLKEHAGRMFEMLGEVAMRPTFPDKPLATLKSQVVMGLSVSANNPAHLAGRELSRRLFGAHPYARQVSGEIADVNARTAEDLRRTWRAFAQPRGAALIVAGDIEPAEALACAERVFGGWTAAAPPPAVELPPLAGPESTRIVVVDRPGAGQSEIRVGRLGISHADPALARARLVGAYFGGSFGSRLNKAVRVEKGRTYGAFGGFTPSRFAGAFACGTFTKTDQTADTVKQILSEVRRLVQEPPTEDELTRHRRYFLGSAAARHETPQQIAGMLAHVELNGLPPDYFRTLYAEIGRLDAEACMGFVRRAVEPDRVVVVVVGDAAKIVPPLKSIAPVAVVDSTGKEK